MTTCAERGAALSPPIKPSSFNRAVTEDCSHPARQTHKSRPSFFVIARLGLLSAWAGHKAYQSEPRCSGEPSATANCSGVIYVSENNRAGVPAISARDNLADAFASKATALAAPPQPLDKRGWKAGACLAGTLAVPLRQHGYSVSAFCSAESSALSNANKSGCSTIGLPTSAMLRNACR